MTCGHSLPSPEWQNSECLFCGQNSKPTSAISLLAPLRQSVNKAISQLYPQITCPVMRCRVRDWLLHMIRKEFLHGIEFVGPRNVRKQEREEVLLKKVKAFQHMAITFRRNMNLSTTELRKKAAQEGIQLKFLNGNTQLYHFTDPRTGEFKPPIVEPKITEERAIEKDIYMVSLSTGSNEVPDLVDAVKKVLTFKTTPSS